MVFLDVIELPCFVGLDRWVHRFWEGVEEVWGTFFRRFCRLFLVHALRGGCAFRVLDRARRVSWEI